MRHSAAAYALAVLLLGCQQTGPESAPRIRPEDSVFGGIYDYPVRLTDGKFVGAPFVPGGASRPQVTLLPQPRWQIDLDGDGDSETVVLLHESSGGSGGFIYLAVTGLATSSDVADEPAMPAYLLGDRIQVKLVAQGTDGRLKVVVEPGALPRGVSSADVREFEVTDRGLIPLSRITGLLTYGHEVRKLVRCADEEALWVSELQPGAVSEHVVPRGPEPYRARFVSVLGRIAEAPDAEFAAGFDRQVVVSDVQRLENEGPGCARQFDAATFQVYGEEPFWNLTVYADRLEFSMIDSDTRIFSLDANDPGTIWDAQGGVLSVRFSADEPEGQQLLLELRAQFCQDTMAGNLYPWRAHVQIGAENLTGCALSAASTVQ